MKKKPYSKSIVTYVIALVTLFVIFACYEMHRLGDLTPIAYIGAGMIGLLATVVGTYMWRAKQQDMFILELRKIKEKAELRKQLGEHYRDEFVQEIYDEE